MSRIRKRTDKTTQHCTLCKELKTDFFSNGICCVCERARALIKLHSEDMDNLKRSIEHDESILNMKKDILAGIHPITKKALFQSKRFVCNVIRDNKEVFFAEVQGYNRKHALMSIPNIKELSHKNTRAIDTNGTVYLIKGRGI